MPPNLGWRLPIEWRSRDQRGILENVERKAEYMDLNPPRFHRPVCWHPGLETQYVLLQFIGICKFHKHLYEAGMLYSSPRR